MAEIHEGGCLCGAVRYRVTGDDPKFTAVCHCKFCQKRTGSAFAEAVYFDETAVQIVGALKTYEYRTDESGRWVKSEFCPNCGTSVTWTIEAFSWVACDCAEDVRRSELDQAPVTRLDQIGSSLDGFPIGYSALRNPTGPGGV